MILILSYFLGILFYIFTDVIADLYHEKEKEPDDHDLMIGFYHAYFKPSDSLSQRVIILCYFSFTSLTTVGFGDFVPRSDFERIFMAVVILGGVSMFSYIVGNFIQAVN